MTETRSDGFAEGSGSQRSPAGLLLLALVGAAISLACAEWLVRLLAPQSLWFPWASQVNGVTIPRAGASGRHAVPGCFDLQESIGPDGFRGSRRFDPRPAPGVIRIAAIGDSNTYGVGARDDETYPAQLQTWLRRAGLNAEVINAGVPGTGTGEQIAYYEHRVRDFSPEVVVLTVAANDPGDDLVRPFFRLQAGRLESIPYEGDLSSRRQTVRRLANRLPGYEWATQNLHLLGLVRALATARPPARAAAGGITSEMVDLTAAQIRYFADRVDRDGSTLIVTFIPGPVAVESTAGTGERRFATELAARLPGDLPFIDLTPSLLRRFESDRKASLFYPAPDFHPRPQTYSLIAEQVAAVVADTISTIRLQGL